MGGEDNLLERIGGVDILHGVVDRFYERLETAPELDVEASDIVCSL